MNNLGFISLEEYRTCLVSHIDELLTKLSSMASLDVSGGNKLTAMINPVTIKPENIDTSFFDVASTVKMFQKCCDATQDEKTVTLDYIGDAFDMTNFERLALMLAVAPYFDQKYEKVFDKLSGYNEVGAPCIGIVIKLYKLIYKEDDIDSLVRMFTLGRVFKLIYQKQPGLYGPSYPLVPHTEIVAAALGFYELDESLSKYCTRKEPEDSLDTPIFGEELIAKVLRLSQNILDEYETSKNAIILRGRTGSGRLFTICHVLKQLEVSMLCVDVNYLCQDPNLDFALDSIERECVLYDRALCLCNANYTSHTKTAEATARIFERASEFTQLFFVTANVESEVFFNEGRATLSVIDTTEPDYATTLLLLKKYAKIYDTDEGLDCEALAARFRITPGDIKRAFQSAEVSANLDNSKVIKTEHFLAGVSKMRKNELGDLGDFVPCRYTFEDLVTSQKNKELMKSAINHVNFHNIVMDKWGMHKKSSYGNNVCVLLYGAPGTGKTMAAQVMAKEVGMDLFRVDSSQLTSKYIGETSKNIRAVFDRAKGSNIVLFFDEADSIFAKRTNQTNDATDRYANSDTSFLLQKLEDYDGFVILSTNLLQNIDDAFRRRMTYMINIIKPDEQLRHKMWKGFITEELPHEELDFNFLATFDLVGSDIKAIMMSAAYMAAGDGKILSMEHVIKSLSNYMQKKGTPLFASDLKQYQEFII